MPPFHVEKLSDEFGQYTLILNCPACGYERVAAPKILGQLCGWDTRLDEVAKRLRCSKCGKKQCTVRAMPAQKPLRG
jgi:rRNA maturation protein Nop10